MSPYCITTSKQLLAALEGTPIARGDFHSQLTSTNDWLAQQLQLSNRPRLPRVVLAESQTAGRGRGANQWITTPGALTFSLALDPLTWGFPESHWPILSLTSALAMAETLTELAPMAQWQCKWPNDVFGNRRKVCGILLEVPPARPPCLVIGIGVNVNNAVGGHDAEWCDRATSLIELRLKPTSLADVLRGFVIRFQAVSLAIREHPDSLISRWEARSLLANRRVTIRTVSGELTGEVVGIDTTGAIRLQVDSEIVTCVSGTVVRYDLPTS